MKNLSDKVTSALRRIAGWKVSSKPDNNFRRLLTRTIWVILLVLLVSVLSPDIQGIGTILSVVFVTLSAIYFATNVIVVLFLTSRTFRVDATRLFVDVFTSAAFSILGMASLHQIFGLSDGTGVVRVTGIEALYFSIVTFTTLGFGDFAPTADLRIVTAIHALMGNLHLGAMIGAAFLAASERFGPVGRSKKSQRRVKSGRSLRRSRQSRPRRR